MEKENLVCPSCGQLAAQMKEDGSISHRQYDQLLQKLMELERQGDMELFAGDCPLEDAGAVLGAETLYRLPLYAVPQLWSPLFCGSLHPGCTGLSAGGRHQKRKPWHPAVGPVWNLLLTEKRLKEA